jgi:hypothetical protein
VIGHIHGGLQPQDFRIWRRLNAAQECAVEAFIRPGRNSAYSVFGPTREMAIRRVALFLAASRSRRRGAE